MPAAVSPPDGHHERWHGVNQCNIYDYNDLSLASSLVIGNFGAAPLQRQRPTPSGARSTAHVDLSLDNIDYVGVYIETIHHNQTHTYFGDFTIQRQVVFRLEPALGP